MAVIANRYFKTSEEAPENWVNNIDRMLRRRDLDGIRDAYTSFLASIPYEANKDERAMDFESHFQYTFYIINRLLSHNTGLYEKQNGNGCSGIIIENSIAVYIFVFILDGSAEEALRQIDDKQYALPYRVDPRPIHKIGVDISSENRTVRKWKTAADSRLVHG